MFGASYAQTADNAQNLAKLFAGDVELLRNVTQDTYLPKPPGANFTQTLRLKLNYNSSLNSSDIRKILVIAETGIYNSVQNRIERYAYDINYYYGCEVKLYEVSDADHGNIKSLILSNQTNLNGVVLVGDLPAAWFEVANDFNTYGYASWPCDLYYMDLDGTWTDTDSDGIFNTHTGNVQPEIFVGRISTAHMGTLLSEVQGMKDYLDKNHDFWTGYSPVYKRYALAYTDHDWANTSYFKTSVRYLYGDSYYDEVNQIDHSYFGPDDYLDRLENDRYEFVQLSCHSAYYYHAMTGGNIYGNEVFNTAPEAIGYNLFCCSGVRWTSVSSSSTRGYLGGAYVYNSNTSGLVAVGSTKTGSLLQFANLYNPLGDGDSFGSALVDWWNSTCGTSHSENEIFWHYGISIIGDPMVSLNPDFPDCPYSMTITNAISYGATTYLAKGNIIATNDITGTANIHYGANSYVRLSQGFYVAKGAKFLATLEGCSTTSGTKSEVASDEGNDDVSFSVSRETFAITPNPATDIVTVKGVAENDIIEVLENSGRIVLTYMADGPTAELDLSSLGKGIYYVSVSTEEGILTEKLILER